MSGEGNEQLVAAMEQLLIQENARKNFLQASSEEINILIPFDDRVLAFYTAKGSGQELENLYDTIKQLRTGGGTDMYAAAERGLKMLEQYDLSSTRPPLSFSLTAYPPVLFQTSRKLIRNWGRKCRYSPSCSEMRTKPSWRNWLPAPTPGFLTDGKI